MRILPGRQPGITNADILAAVQHWGAVLKEEIMSLSDEVGALSTNDATLTGLLSTLLGDYATALGNAASAGDIAAVTQVATDLATDAANITAADPTNVATVVAAAGPSALKK